jgi:hypothetical protein
MYYQNLEINDKIYEVLKTQFSDEIEINTAILYLTSIAMDLKVNCFSEEMIRKVNLLKIVTRNYSETNKLTWLIPLHVKVEETNLPKEWDWISEYRNIFGKVGKDYKSDEKSVLRKMMKYFSENPSVRKEDVIDAAKLYCTPFINNQKNKQYMTNAGYFISKKIEGVYHFKLTQYIEIVKESRNKSGGNNARMSVIS